MNRIVWMLPGVTRNSTVLLEKWNSSKGQPECLLPEYEEFRCRKCQKFDEYKALRYGISPNVRVRGRTDVVLSGEGFKVVNSRFRSLMEDNAIQGVEFLAIPSEGNYFVMAPTLIVPTNQTCLERLGMKFGRLCGQCGRYGETYAGWPERQCMAVPDDEYIIFASSVRCEWPCGDSSTFFTTEVVQAIIERAKITGIDSFISVEG